MNQSTFSVLKPKVEKCTELSGLTVFVEKINQINLPKSKKLKIRVVRKLDLTGPK
jgi:hypothetical protein